MGRAHGGPAAAGRLMFEPLEIPEAEANAVVSTGHLPDPELVARLVREAHDRYKDNDEGTVADYIPALARVDRKLFGFAIVGVNGGLHEIGDAGHPFSIQSVSKPFVFALVCRRSGRSPRARRSG